MQPKKRISVAQPAFDRFEAIQAALTAARGRDISQSETVEYLLEQADQAIRLLLDIANAPGRAL